MKIGLIRLKQMNKRRIENSEQNSEEDSEEDSDLVTIS